MALHEKEQWCVVYREWKFKKEKKKEGIRRTSLEIFVVNFLNEVKKYRSEMRSEVQEEVGEEEGDKEEGSRNFCH